MKTTQNNTGLQMFDRSNLKGLNEETQYSIIKRYNSFEDMLKALKAARTVIPYGNESLEIMIDNAIAKATK